jgi:monovalent cation:proton antiporter-2 (CPA2) family protein
LPVNALFFYNLVVTLASSSSFFYNPFMTLHEFLISAFWFLVAAVFFVPIFKRLGLGSLLGYIAAGATLGPWALKSVGDVEGVSRYAELGVVFLLFVIGLELKPQKLWAMRKSVFGLGFLQMLITSIALGSIARVCGLPWDAAIICGFALSLTSTAFALQLMNEKNHLRTDYGQQSFSVLLFQDLIAIPALAVIPFFSEGASATVSTFSPLALARVIGIILFVIVCGRFLLRPVLRMIAWTQTREIFTATALLFVISVSLIMEAQGVSMSLGAFLAGILLADSEYRHEIESDIEPFKGLLLGLFFISVGMLIDFGLVYRQFPIIALLAVGLMSVKFVINYALARFFRLPVRSAQNMAVVLSPAGEFGFVIFAVALNGKLISEYYSHLLVATVTLSMVLTPLIFIIKERLGERFINAKTTEFDPIKDDRPQVIIAGFGRVGQMTGRLLRVLWIPFTALELDGEHVEVVRKFGNKVYYGDASRLDLLMAAGAQNAEVFVIAIDDPEASVKIVQTIKKHFPHLKIISRARNRQGVFELMDLGVKNIYRETFASSLEMAEKVLLEIGMPAEKARNTVKTFREHDERNLQDQQAIRHNEKELIALSKQAVDQLEKTLQSDLAQ